MLNQLRERMMQAENAGDATFFEDASAKDVVLMPPNMPAVSGRAATVAFMHGFPGHFDLHLQCGWPSRFCEVAATIRSLELRIHRPEVRLLVSQARQSYNEKRKIHQGRRLCQD